MQRINNILDEASEAIIRAIIACGPSTSAQIARVTGIPGKSLRGHLAAGVRSGRLQNYTVPGCAPRFWLGVNSLPALGGLNVPGHGYIEFGKIPASWFRMKLSSPRALLHLDGCAELGVVLASTGEGLVLCERMADLLKRVTGNPFGISTTGHRGDVVLLRKGRKPRVYEYERWPKVTDEGDEILIGWAYTEDTEVFYVTATKRARQHISCRVRKLAEGKSDVAKKKPVANVVNAITIISAEESFPSAATLTARAPRCRGQLARPHNKGGRPRATARRRTAKTRARS